MGRLVLPVGELTRVRDHYLVKAMTPGLQLIIIGVALVGMGLVVLWADMGR